MITDRLAQLISRQLSGEASKQELTELDALLKEDPEAKYFFDIFSDYWNIGPKKTTDDIQEEIHFQQILAIAENENKASLNAEDETQTAPVHRIFPVKKLLIAASFASIIILSYFLFFNTKSTPRAKEIAVNLVEAKKGTKSFMQLPDGSKVWLNSDSKLEYKGNLNDSTREVTLTGEAYFDVVKDSRRPFIVHTSDIDIRVLGTAFNVKSYPLESSIEATLIHGVIQVINNKQQSWSNVILHQHEKFVFLKKENQAIKKPEEKHAAVGKPFIIAPLPENVPDTARIETSWVYNRLILDGSFKETALKMERWYNVKIVFLNDRSANLSFHHILENETIEEALNNIQHVANFNYRIKDAEIEIF